LPATIEWSGNVPRKGAKMTLLQTGKTVKYTVTGDRVKVTLPATLIKPGATYPALAFHYF